MQNETNELLAKKHFLTGNEQFTFNGREIGHSLLDYWSWSFSDIYNNIYRGILAEYLVATALRLTPPEGHFMRIVWDSCDMVSLSGKRVEVKSAAFLQSWDGELSKISYGIAPARQHGSDAVQRNNDVYVFCLFAAKTRAIPLTDLDWWEFYVLPTAVLNKEKPRQKTITFDSLMKLVPKKCRFDNLFDAVESC